MVEVVKSKLQTDFETLYGEQPELASSSGLKLTRFDAADGYAQFRDEGSLRKGVGVVVEYAKNPNSGATIKRIKSLDNYYPVRYIDYNSSEFRIRHELCFNMRGNFRKWRIDVYHNGDDVRLASALYDKTSFSVGVAMGTPEEVATDRNDVPQWLRSERSSLGFVKLHHQSTFAVFDNRKNPPKQIGQFKPGEAVSVEDNPYSFQVTQQDGQYVFRRLSQSGIVTLEFAAPEKMDMEVVAKKATGNWQEFATTPQDLPVNFKTTDI